MRDSEGFVRMRTLQCVVLFVFLLIGGRLAYIQLIDSRYNELAKANVLRHVVQYPPRGEVFDRNGEYLVQSRECYDLMVIYSEIDKKVQAQWSAFESVQHKRRRAYKKMI